MVADQQVGIVLVGDAVPHNVALKLTVGLRHLSRIIGVSWLEATRSLTPCYAYYGSNLTPEPEGGNVEA